jgi:hypothetical protein
MWEYEYAGTYTSSPIDTVGVCNGVLNCAASITPNQANEAMVAGFSCLTGGSSSITGSPTAFSNITYPNGESGGHGFVNSLSAESATVTGCGDGSTPFSAVGVMWSIRGSIGGSGTGFNGGAGTSFQDALEIAAPANPASTYDRLYLDSTAHQLKCLTSSGGSCMPSGSGTVTTSGSPVSPNIAAFSSSTAITAATSANIQTAIGASVYDAYGAAAARQANLNLAPGTYADGDMCTYASSGTLLNCNTAVPGAYTLPSQYKTWSCEPGLGDGLNAITAGTYLQSTCWNKTGATVTLTGVGCFTDNAGSSTLNAAGNTLGALLTGAVTCTSSLASGTQSSNVLLTNGDYIKFTFVADGTSKQTTFVVTGSY